MTCGTQGEELLSLGGGTLGGSQVLLGPGRAIVPIQECQLELGEVETSVRLLCWGRPWPTPGLKRAAASALCQASKIVLLLFLKVKLPSGSSQV